MKFNFDFLNLIVEILNLFKSAKKMLPTNSCAFLLFHGQALENSSHVLLTYLVNFSFSEISFSASPIISGF